MIEAGAERRRSTTCSRRFDPVPVAAASIGQVHLAELPSRPPRSPSRCSARTPRRQIERRPRAAPPGRADRQAPRRPARRSSTRWRSWTSSPARSAASSTTASRPATPRSSARNFAESDRASSSRKVYGTYSSERVLTLERLEGIQLGDLDLAATPMDERRRLAILIAEAWLEMIFRHGPSTATRIPANIFVLGRRPARARRLRHDRRADATATCAG